MMDTADVLLDKVLNALAVADFGGISAADFWAFVDENVETSVDAFMQLVLWSWLTQNRDIEVWTLDKDKTKKGKVKGVMDGYVLLEEKPGFEIFQEKEVQDKYKIKVSSNFQSLYLTGLIEADNNLGKMPYDLLRIIAKHKEAGVTSPILIKESGQDNRSLTPRLQILQDNFFIEKKPVLAHSTHTYHMTHFRFCKPGAELSAKSNNEEFEHYDRYTVITYIMSALKNEADKVRLTSDLFEELKQISPTFKVKQYNAILRLLNKIGFIEHIQVEHTELMRLFPAIRFLKDIPHATKKSEFFEKIRALNALSSTVGLGDPEANDDEEDNDNENENESENDIPQSKMNRFFPLPNQVFSLVDKNPGIMATSIDTFIHGDYTNKMLNNLLDAYSTATPNPENPNSIVGQLSQNGKNKFYRFKTQNYINRKNPEYVKPEEKSITIEPVNRPLVSVCCEYSRTIAKERRLRFISLLDDNQKEKFYVISKGYGGKLGLSLSLKLGNRAVFSGDYISRNGLVTYNMSSRKLQKDLEQYNERVKFEMQFVKEYNESLKTIQPRGEKKFRNNVKEMEILDYGPEYRRKELLKFIDAKKCVFCSTDLCQSLTKSMNLDYVIDSRTLKRDAKILESKNLIKIEVDEETGRLLFTSIKNEPSELDIKKMSVAKDYSNRTSSRVFTDKIQVSNLKVKFKPSYRWNKRLENVSRAISEKNIEQMNRRKRNRIVFKKIKEETSEEEEEVDFSEEDEQETAGNDNELENDVSLIEGEEVVGLDSGDLLPRSKGTRRRRNKAKDTDDVLNPLLDHRKRKKMNKSKGRAARVAKTFKKIRAYIKISNTHILTLIKSIIISQSLSANGNIDWVLISDVFEDSYPIDTLKRQWPRSRKILGQSNLLQAKKNWENVLLDGISEGIVTIEDLDNHNIHKLLDLWKGSDADIFINKVEYEISENYDENFRSSYFKPLKSEVGIEVFREPGSMVLKQQHWTSQNFMYPLKKDQFNELLERCENPTIFETAKTKLKALFATPVEKFSSSKVRQLFSDIPKELYSKALTELEDKKAIAFLGDESKIKFSLTDRLLLILDCKMDDAFVENAKKIIEILDDVDSTKTGFLLSNRCASGSFAAIFSLIAEENVTLTRIDQKVSQLKSYYTKAQDRSKLESDFLLTHFKKGNVQRPKNVEKPTGAPCSYIWIDLDGDFNDKLFRKCAYVLIWSIVFNIGVKISKLCARMEPLLEPFEVLKLLNYLVERGNIIQGDNGSYWPSSCWYDL